MIYVTGGTGYLGSNIIRYFAELGLQVTALHRSEQPPLISSSANVTSRLLDYSRLFSLNPIEDDNSILIHAASPTSSHLNNQPDLLPNVLTQDRLLYEYALSRNTRHIVYLSTIQVYGQSLCGLVTSATETHPLSLYSRYKHESERQLSETFNHSTAHRSILRLSNVFGRPCPYNHHSWDLFIHDIVRQSILSSSISIKSSHQHVRDFVPISHFLSSLRSLLNITPDPSRTHIYNICTGTSKTLLSVAQDIQDTFKKKFKIDIAIDASNHSPQQHYSLLPSDISLITSNKQYDKVFTAEIRATIVDALSLLA